MTLNEIKDALKLQTAINDNIAAQLELHKTMFSVFEARLKDLEGEE